MVRAGLSGIAYTDHPIAAPVSPDMVRRLLALLDPSPGGHVVDLGCGAGVWLLEPLAAGPDLTAVGVDTALHPERDARARTVGVADRLEWVEADAATWRPGPAHPASDAVICIGVSHAFGGLDGTLDAVRGHLRPGGRALLGDGIWELPPRPRHSRHSGPGPATCPPWPSSWRPSPGTASSPDTRTAARRSGTTTSGHGPGHSWRGRCARSAAPTRVGRCSLPHAPIGANGSRATALS